MRSHLASTTPAIRKQHDGRRLAQTIHSSIGDFGGAGSFGGATIRCANAACLTLTGAYEAVERGHADMVLNMEGVSSSRACPATTKSTASVFNESISGRPGRLLSLFQKAVSVSSEADFSYRSTFPDANAAREPDSVGN